MRRVDLRCPWGRSREDVVSRKREVKAAELHRLRLSKVRSVVDTSSPPFHDLPHLKSRAKKLQVRDEWNHKISTENKVLMEKIMGIMRHGTELTQLPDSATRLRNNLAHMSEVHNATYHRELRRENRFLAERLRTAAPRVRRAEKRRRGDAAAATWIVRRDEARRRRGRDVDSP